MFYRTQLKSIGTDGAVDMQGRRLAFIGYLPCKAGDWVYTDGTVIFGNFKPKGAPAIFDVAQSGIPVLCDSDSTGEKELRGYFTKRGEFKEYKIAQDDWIANSKTKFSHGEKEFKGVRVIDAETNNNGEEFIVTDGFYRKYQTVTYNNHLFYMNARTRSEQNQSTGEIVFRSEHEIIAGVEPIVGQEVTLGADAADIDTPVTIYKNGEKFLEIPLGVYAEQAIQECWRARDYLSTEQSSYRDLTESLRWDCPNEIEPVNFIQQPPPPNDFIALSCARVESFRVDAEGNWDAIIATSAYGYCFLYMTLPASVFNAQFDDYPERRGFSKSLILGLDDLESAIFDENLYPFLTIEKYPRSRGKKKSTANIPLNTKNTLKINWNIISRSCALNITVGSLLVSTPISYFVYIMAELTIQDSPIRAADVGFLGQRLGTNANLICNGWTLYGYMIQMTDIPFISILMITGL